MTYNSEVLNLSSLGLQLPAEKVVGVGFGGLTTF